MWAALLACREPPTDRPSPPDGPDAHTAAHTGRPPGEPTCPRFGAGRVVGDVTAKTPSEISGLVAWDGVLWAVDDGEDDLYAFDPSGALRGTAHFVGSVDGVDREDLGRWNDQLLVADTGDNRQERASVALYRFERPPPDGFHDDWPLAGSTVVTWPGGPTDAETLIVDPVTDDVLLVEKARDGVSTVLRVPGDLPDAVEGEAVAELVFGGDTGLGTVNWTTGGTVAPDGTAVVIRTYLDAWVWPRVPGEPWADTFARDACWLDLVTEPQGESIAWGDDGIYTISEGVGPTVLFYPLL